jgi:hypothetical protein
MLDEDEKIELEKMMDLRFKELEARIAELVSKGNSRPAQAIILTRSDIVAYALVFLFFVASVAAASYFTDALLHDRFLKASVAITEGLTSRVGATPALIIGNATPWFFNITTALTIALVWWDSIIRAIGFCKRHIKVED